MLVTKQIEASHFQGLELPKHHHKKVEVVHVVDDDNGVPHQPAAEKMLEYLTAQAKRSQDA
eukprot:6692733-Heterocapsa_arctica.AAC.1